jgi:hypothetical protein
MVKRLAVLLMVVSATAALFAAVGYGESRLLATRGVEASVIELEDGSRWVQGSVGRLLTPTQATSDTVVMDPNNPAMHASSPAALAAQHGRPPLLVALLAAVAAMALGAAGAPVRATPAPARTRPSSISVLTPRGSAAS